MSRVNLVDLGRPPGLYGGIERVESTEAADLLWAGNVHAHGQPHAPRAHGIGNAGQLLQVLGVQQLGRGIHVVNVEAVDAHRGQQARVFGHRCQVLANIAAFKEDRPSGVAALDGAVGIVPLVDPADGHGRVFADVQVGQIVAIRETPVQVKDTIQDAPVVGACNNQSDVTLKLRPMEPISFRLEIGGDGQLGVSLVDLLCCAQERFAGEGTAGNKGRGA